VFSLLLVADYILLFALVVVFCVGILLLLFKVVTTRNVLREMIIRYDTVVYE